MARSQSCFDEESAKNVSGELSISRQLGRPEIEKENPNHK
jgi:hypothetical protein